MQTDQGIKNIPVDKAGHLAGGNPDYSIQDLYEAIATGNFVRSENIFYGIYSLYFLALLDNVHSSNVF